MYTKSQKYNLGNLTQQSQGNTRLDSLHEPDIDTLNILPCTESGQPTECDYTFNGTDFNACSFGPRFVQNSKHDESETIE